MASRKKRQAAIKADEKIRQLQEQEKSSSEENEIYDEDSGEDERPREEEQDWRNAQSVIQTPSTREEVHRNDQKPVMDEVDEINSKLRSMDVTDPRVAEVCRHFKEALGSLGQSPIPTAEHSFATCATQASVIQQHSSFHYPGKQPPSLILTQQPMGYQPGTPLYAPQAAYNHPAFTYAQPAMNQQFHPGVQPQQAYYAVPPHHQANFQPTTNQQFAQGFHHAQTHFAAQPQHQMYYAAQPQDNQQAMTTIPAKQNESEQIGQLIGLQLSAQRDSNIQKVPCLNGYEGEASLQNFFTGFEKATRGAGDTERIEMLHSKCRGRAKRLMEEMKRDGLCNYVEIKQNLSQHVRDASTDQEDAMRMLSLNTSQAHTESLAEYAERINQTVTKAFPSSDKASREKILNHYFMAGIRNDHLHTFLAGKEELPLEEKIEKAIRLENRMRHGRRSLQGGQGFDGTRNQREQRATGWNSSRSNNQGVQRQLHNNRGYQQGFTGQEQQRERETAQRQHVTPSQSAATGANSTAMRNGQRPPSGNGSRFQRTNQVQHAVKERTKASASSADILLVPTLELTINGLLCRGLFDTGASVSIMSQGCYSKIAGEPGTILPTSSARQCIGANGQPIKIIGEVVLPVEYKSSKLTEAHFQIAADTFGHEAIIGTDILNALGFEIFDRKHNSYHTMRSLTQLTTVKKKKEAPIRVLRATTVAPNESSVIEVQFEGKDAELYIMEPPDCLSNEIRLESALVHGDEGKRNWLLHNKSNYALNLPEGATIGYAGEVRNVLENDSQHKEEVTKRVNNLDNAGEDDLPFALTPLEDETQLPRTDRMLKLLEQIRSNCKSLEETKWKEISAIVEEFAECFAVSDNELTQTDIVTHSIDTGDQVPVKSRQRPIAHAMKEHVVEMVLKYLRQGVIRESHSPWSSQIVLVKKKDGTIRMCVDYRKLNDITVKDAFPIPNINELLSSLGSKRFFTTFDLLSGYWQIRMDAEAIEKTAFTSPLGHHEFTVMPFGLTNAVATFQRAMQGIFADVLNDFVYVYIDDIMIASETWEDHVKHITEVLRRLEKAGLRLKATKCQFARSEVQFLGYLLTSNGLRIDPSKVDPIRNYPEPENIKELQRFLGLATYNRKFVQGFAQIASPLHNLLKPQAKFKFDDRCREAFEKLKEKLCEEVTLAFPDYEAAQKDEKRQFVIMTDASGEGLGGVLCQADKNGNCRPIHYVSRRCSEAERRYSPTELEALAIKFACDKLEQYIQFIPVKVLTDHQPLVGIFRKQGTSNKRITRFIAEMIPHFQLDVQYLAGKSNVMADALSRALPKKEREPKEAQVTALAVTISKGQWKEQLRMDGEYGRIIALIEGNDPAQTAEEAKEALSYAESFSTDENHLYCVMKDGARRKVVPAEVRNEILVEFHEGTTGVHASAAKLYEIISRDFFWKNLRSSCESFCQRCTTCTLNRVGRNQRPPLDAIRSTAAMEMLCVDVLKLGPSRAGNLYAVVMIDQFSKYLVASAVPDKSATSVMQAITTDWIARFGAPSCIHSDNGSEFCNSTMTALCESLGIIHSTASVYHPMGNGVTERVNRDIISMLRKTVPSQFDWDQRLPFVLLAHNVMVHRATKFSPYEIIFGKKPRLPILDEGDRSPDSRYTVDIDAYHLLLTENLEWVKKQSQPNLSKAAGEYEQYYDARVRARPHHFNIGDSVVIRKMPKSKVSREKHRKLEFLNEGPFKVTSARKTSVEIERNDGKREWIRAERVLPYVASADIASINVSFQNKHKIGLTMITAEELDYDEEPIQPETIPMEVKESEGEVQSATERQSPTHKWEIESNIDCHISVIRSGDVDEGIPAKIPLKERIARKPPTPQRVKKDDRIRRAPMKGSLSSRLSTSNRRPDQRRVLASPKEQSVDETIEVVAGIPRDDLRHDYVIIGDQLAEVIGRRCDNECHSLHSCKELADWSNGEDSEATHVLVAISRLFPLRHGEENYTMALRHLIRSQRDRDPARQVLVLAPPPLRNIALYHDRWLNTLQLCCEGESNASLVCNEGFHSVITSFFYGAEANRELIAEDGSLTVKGKKVLELTLKELVKMPLRWKDA